MCHTKITGTQKIRTEFIAPNLIRSPEVVLELLVQVLRKRFPCLQITVPSEFHPAPVAERDALLLHTLHLFKIDDDSV